MINQDKIKIYKRYSGDIDGWTRVGSVDEQLFMNDEDWYIIDELIQDFSLVKKGIASPAFINDLNIRLKRNCDSEKTIQVLKELFIILPIIRSMNLSNKKTVNLLTYEKSKQKEIQFGV